jgi:hypothetical protein
MATKQFSTGEVLTASDTNTFLNNAGLVLITSGITVSSAGGTAATVSDGTVTIGTSNTSVTVSGAFSATYDNYRIIISGGVGSIQNNVALQLSGITTSVYNQLGYFQQWGTSTVNGYAANATSIIAIEASTSGSASEIDLKNPFLSIRKFGKIEMQSNHSQYDMPFYINSTASATGFILTPASGNLTGGTIRVYGYRQV